MCRFSIPPGYTRTKPVAKPKLGTLLPVIDAILEADRTAPGKQRHPLARMEGRDVVAAAGVILTTVIMTRFGDVLSLAAPGTLLPGAVREAVPF